MPWHELIAEVRTEREVPNSGVGQIRADHGVAPADAAIARHAQVVSARSYQVEGALRVGRVDGPTVSIDDSL